MTQLTVTLPTKKAGKILAFTIQFSISNFDAVVDAVAEIKTIEELNNNSLWKVL